MSEIVFFIVLYSSLSLCRPRRPNLPPSSTARPPADGGAPHLHLHDRGAGAAVPVAPPPPALVPAHHAARAVDHSRRIQLAGARARLFRPRFSPFRFALVYLLSGVRTRLSLWAPTSHCHMPRPPSAALSLGRQAHFWPFLTAWTLYTVGAGIIVRKATSRPLPKDAPRTVYRFFLTVHQVGALTERW